MQSRRGETYIGGDYSIPTGMEPDVHYKKDIHCADCHSTGVRGMGDMQRKAHCQDCHIEIEEAHAASIHRNLDCSTCHINELRGYQVVIWGPGEVAGKANPFKKYSLYYGIQKPPILMKDQKGRWMAVKVFPHSVGNMANDVGPSGKVQFRWPGGETRDPYYIVGTFSAPSNNKHLLWLEIQQASHPYGKGRSCGSCHGDRQVTTSRWEYMDDQGAAAPFAGGYRIVADKDGLRVVDLRSTSEIKPAPGYKPEDFAAWLYFRDKWSMPGDFSISTEKEKYARYLSLSKKMEVELREMEKRVGKDDKRAQKRFKELRGVVRHNEDKAPDAIGAFREKAGR